MDTPTRSHFIMIPWHVWAQCDPAELAVWVVVAMVAGEEGVCFLSSRQLADATGLSLGAVCAARKRLLGKVLLEGEIVRDPGCRSACWHLRLPDGLWQSNGEYAAGCPSLLERIERKRAALQAEREKRRAKPDKSLHQVKRSPDERVHQMNTFPTETRSPDERVHHMNSSVHLVNEIRSRQEDPSKQNERAAAVHSDNSLLLDLQSLGFEPAKARLLLEKHGTERVTAWITYARSQKGLSNPAGYLVARLNSGDDPPPGADDRDGYDVRRRRYASLPEVQY